MSPEERSEQKKRADKLEKWLAIQLDGRRVPGSGSLNSWKGDVELSDYLIDSKHTLKSTINLSAKDLGKIHKEARNANRSGHLILSYLDVATTFVSSKHWAVVPRKNVEFETTEDKLIVTSSKNIGKTFLESVVRRANKKEKIPSVRIHFEKIMLGVPREWLIIPLNIYKEKFLGEVE